MLIEFRIELSEQLAIRNPTSKIFFHLYLSNWLEQTLPTLAPSTQVSYTRNVNKKIIPYFAEHPIELNKLRPAHISKYYHELLSQGLSPNSVRRIHANIHKALKQAVIDGYIQRNPSEGLTISNPERYCAQYFSPEECRTLLVFIKGTPLEIPITLAILLGLRRSELLGLKWSAFDFETHIVRIQNSLQRIHGEIIERQTLKRKSSHRTLPISPELEAILEPYRKGEGYVCIHSDGLPYTPDQLYCEFQKALTDAGLRHIRLHDLRHTCAALLLQNKIPLVEISNYLGHSSLAITMDLYGHLEFSSKEACASVLAEKVLVNHRSLRLNILSRE